jgi:uncharacterized protein HemX
MSDSGSRGKIVFFVAIIIIIGIFLLFKQQILTGTAEKQSNDLKKGNATQRSIEGQLKNIQADQQKKVDAANAQAGGQPDDPDHK